MDGGYIIAGCTEAYGFGYTDIYLIKTDENNGNKLWEKTFGGNKDYYAYSVCQTEDKGYIVAGYTESFGSGYMDIYLIKIDKDGNKIFEKTFGTKGNDIAFDIAKANDNGYIILSMSYPYNSLKYYMRLIKIDSNGNKIWEKTFNNNYNYGRSISKTKDNGYIITGSIYPNNDYFSDLFLIKVDSKGNKIWGKNYGNSNDDVGFDVKETKDRGYIITGYTDLNFNRYDVYLIKTDSVGNKIWEKTYGGRTYINDYGYSVQQMEDGGYLIGVSMDGAYLLKIDGNGNLKWKMAEHSTAIYSICQSSDYGYVTAGSFEENVFLIKLKSKNFIIDKMPNLTNADDKYINFSPENVERSCNFTANFILMNNGNLNSNAFKIYTYLSEDTNITTSDIKVGDTILYGIMKNSSLKISINCNLPSEIPFNSYYLGFIIDPTNMIMESNENDNICYKKSKKLVVKSNNQRHDNCVDMTIVL